LRLFGVGIFNGDYRKTLEYKNLEKEAKDDAIIVRKIFKTMGIKDENTTFLCDGTYDDLDMFVNEMKLKYLKAQKDGINTLFVIWYCG
jgi:hypothetical protein